MEYFIVFNISVIRYTNLVRNIILQTIIIVIKVPNLFKQVKCCVKIFFATAWELHFVSTYWIIR